jgi:hypothetical protein
LVDVERFGGSVGVEQFDCVLAAIAGEMAVVAVDHGQACSHVAGEVERGDAGAEREGREGVPQIVDAAQRRDVGGVLGRLPAAARTLAFVLGGLTRPFLSVRRTYTTWAWRSMSLCSSASHSPGRSPVAAANSTIGR